MVRDSAPLILIPLPPGSKEGTTSSSIDTAHNCSSSLLDPPFWYSSTDRDVTARD